MADQGRLTTHVLDTAVGRPAADLVIEVYAVSATERRFLTSTATDADGRTAKPLLEGAALVEGVYELVFHAGAYLRARGVELADPPFLDRVVIRFGIADPSQHHHVPLLLSPYGYSTYRGS
jgi:5-hydroxyisourate hydrolase